MPKRVHIIQLTSEERERLLDIAKNGPERISVRAKILLMSDSNNNPIPTTRTISSELGVSLATIQAVRLSYTTSGIDGCVVSKGRLSPEHSAYVTKEKKKAVIELIKKGPQDGRQIWTLESIRKECIKQGLFEYIPKSAVKKILNEEKLDILAPPKKRTSDKNKHRQIAFEKTSINGVLISNSKNTSSNDEQIFEVFDRQAFIASNIRHKYSQDILISSGKGVLRGLRYQTTNTQSKEIWVVSGEVFYVVVDLRFHSITYGQYFSIVLSGTDHKQLIVPKGFAHGYLVLSEHAEIIIKNDVPNQMEYEGGIIWNDPSIGIEWPSKDHLRINEKEKNYPTLSESKITL